MDFTDNNTSYLLKLDYIDANYIANLGLKYADDSCPLWSITGAKTRRYDDNFVEFRVLAGRRNDSTAEPVSSEDDDIIGYPTYKCVICDTDIPILYKREHNNSSKHKTCLKIVEAVLLRIHSHILVADENVTIKNYPNTYFCEPCTIIVKTSDKIEHEATNAHQKSVLHDRYLNDLLSIYLNKEYLDRPDMQFLKPNKSIEEEYVKVNDTEVKDLNKAEETEALKNKAAYSFGHDSSDDEIKTLPLLQKRKRKRKRPDKKQRLASNNTVTTDNLAKNTPNDDIFNAREELLYSDQKSSVIKQIDSVDNQEYEVSSEEAFKQFRNIFEELNLSSDDDESIDTQYKYDDKSSPMGKPDHLIFETDSLEEEYHSVDESNHTPEQELLINDKNNTIYEDASTKVENQSIGDQDIVIEEEQPSKSDRNEPTVVQINEKANNSTVDYIMLVNSDEFDVDMKMESVKSILGESSLEKYLKIVGSTYLTCLNKDYIKIVTRDNCILTVRANNFNGFYLSDGRLQCRLCMVMVDEDPVVHIHNVDHMKHVGVPLENMHCYRQITDTFKHCIHCNDTFCNIDTHKSLDSHLKALNEAIGLSIPAKPVETKKVGQTFCEPCELYIDSHNFNSHTNGKPHKNNLSLFFTKETKKSTENTDSNTDTTFCNECNSFVLIANFAVHLNQHANKEVGGDNKNFIENKIFCEPCNKQIDKNQFPSHVYGKNHQTSLISAKESKGLQKENYCATCKIYVKKMSSHVTEAYHEFYSNKINGAKNINAAVPTPNSITSETNNNYYQINFMENGAVCRICVAKVPNNPENIKQHTNGRVHLSNYKALLSNNKVKLENNKFLCEACNIAIDLTKEIDHIKSIAHKSAFSKRDKTLCNICKVFVLKSNWSSHLDSDHHQYHSAKQSQNAAGKKKNEVPSTSSETNNSQINLPPKENVCRVCDVTIPTKPELILEHTKGKAHRNKLDALLDKNKFKLVKSKFFCDVCKISLDPAQIIDHIRSATHENALKNYDNPSQKNTQTVLYHCDSCDVDVLNTPSSIQEHKDTVTHKIGEAFSKVTKRTENPAPHYHYENANSPNTLKCRICEKDVNTTDSKKHLESPAHIFKYLTVLHENKIQKVADKFMCQICSIEINKEEELKHVRSLTHLFEKQAAMSSTSQASSTGKTGYRCAVCQVDVPNNPKNIAIHDQGTSHIVKLKNLSFEDEEKVLMTATNNGREMFCSLCKVKVPVSGVSDHVRGARHRANKVVATTK